VGEGGCSKVSSQTESAGGTIDVCPQIQLFKTVYYVAIPVMICIFMRNSCRHAQCERQACARSRIEAMDYKRS
jgi:hypothetical protein